MADLRSRRALMLIKQYGPMLAVAVVFLFIGKTWGMHQNESSKSRDYQRQLQDYERVWTAWIAQHPKFKQDTKGSPVSK